MGGDGDPGVVDLVPKVRERPKAPDEARRDRDGDGRPAMSTKTKTTTTKSKGKRKRAGRPRIEFDLEAVEGLGRIGATAPEMAHILPASQSTIEHRMADRDSDFSKAYEKGRSLLNGSLRRKQIQVAMSGNVTMLIWLGKQVLGQTDRAQLEHGGRVVFVDPGEASDSERWAEEAKRWE